MEMTNPAPGSQNPHTPDTDREELPAESLAGALFVELDEREYEIDHVADYDFLVRSKKHGRAVLVSVNPATEPGESPDVFEVELYAVDRRWLDQSPPELLKSTAAFASLRFTGSFSTAAVAIKPFLRRELRGWEAEYTPTIE